MCKITVLMSVKNGERFITDCMDSVLNQTFTDFEFLIFDDDSSDGTVEILKGYQDGRIKIFTETAGYVGNLNKGIEISKGRYIAKMDHDDIMDTTKLAIQFELMENMDIDVCATWIYNFGEGVAEPYMVGSINGYIEDPITFLSLGNNISHPSVMLKKEFLIKNHLKYEDYFPADDYKLWFEIAKKGGKFYMVPKPLLSYRFSFYQSGTILVREQNRIAASIRQEIKAYLQGHSTK